MYLCYIVLPVLPVLRVSCADCVCVSLCLCVSVYLRLCVSVSHSITSIILSPSPPFHSLFTPLSPPQRQGICMLGDLKDVGFGNFDPRVPKEISRALAGHLPVRMGRMILFKAPVSVDRELPSHWERCAWWWLCG